MTIRQLRAASYSLCGRHTAISFVYSPESLRIYSFGEGPMTPQADQKEKP